MNPELYGGSIKDGQISTAGGAVPVKRVEFDVAVIEGGSKEAGGGASIKVFSVGADGSGKLIKSSEATSRVRFSIPIALPPASNPHRQRAGIIA